MIILPTIYRPDSLKRFVQAYKDTDGTLPVWVMLDIDNAGPYAGIELPKLWRKVRVSSGVRIGAIFNTVFRHSPNEDFYAILADDVVPETNRWDLVLKEACLPDKISWGFDGGHDETLPRHPFIGGNLVRKMGYISPLGVQHWYVDNAWRDIASALDCGDYRPEVRMTHHHYTAGRSQKDRTYTEQPDNQQDEIVYRMWREQEFPGLIERIQNKC